MNSHVQHNFFNHHASSGLTTEIQSSLVPHSDFSNSLKTNGRSSGESIRVVPPTQSVDRKSQADWQDFWWKTRLTKYGTKNHPDPVASDNDFRKTGSVQMLAGTGIGSPPRIRDIQVNDKTYLFSPIITLRADNDEFPPAWDEADSRYLVKMIVDVINPETDLFYEVDGQSLINGAAWQQHRQQSAEAFSYRLPQGGRKVDYTVTDGYVVMLNPLPAGTYTIHFGATIKLGDIGDGIIEDLDEDGVIGIPGIPEPTTEQIIAATPEQVTEYLLKLYQGFGTQTVDVTYNVQVTHSSATPSSLDLSALAAV